MNASQDVHICSREFTPGAFSPRFVVLVAGEYYEVFKHGLAALQRGVTPQELELEPYEERNDEY